MAHEYAVPMEMQRHQQSPNGTTMLPRPHGQPLHVPQQRLRDAPKRIIAKAEDLAESKAA